MIKINLLPISDADRIEDGKSFFAMLFFVFVIVSLFAYLLQRQDQEELESKRAGIQRLQRDRQELQKKVQQSKDLEETFKQLKVEVDHQQEVINDLTQNQVSPAALLSEIAYLLSPPSNDTERENFAQKGWRWSWNTGELWVDRFKEEQRQVRLTGYARTINDVSELLTRLNSSPHFIKPRLKFTEADKVSFPNGRRGEFVRFEIESRALYGASDLKALFEQSGEPLPGSAGSSIGSSTSQPSSVNR